MPPSEWREGDQERSLEMEPAMPQTALPANPGKQFRGTGEELSGLVVLMSNIHAEIIQRFDQQDTVLQQLTAAKRPLFPVAAMASGSEASSANVSVGCSDASGNSRDQPRRKKNDKKKPTLFSTFTQFDLQKRDKAMNAEENYESEVPPSSVHQVSWARRVVDDTRFDVFFAAVVITNSLFIGVDVQMNPSAYGARPLWIQIAQFVYTILFSVEFAMRVAAFGKQYFCSSEWAWGFLDLFIVVTSWWELFVEMWYTFAEDESSFESFGGLTGLKAFRIVRLTRIVKTVRLMRIFRFVLALRTLIHSILHTLKSLFWALVLLVLIVYVFALIFTQSVADHLTDESAHELSEENLEASRKYFGTLMSTMLSLFMTVTDGVSWEKVIAPLGAISWIWSSFFLFYVAFTYFAVLNVLTGVFCQSAIESAQNDHATAIQSMIANKEAHLTKVRALFNQLGTDERSVITFRQFEDKINSDEVREYFETLGLDVWDAWSFFKLLDRDGGGSVEIEEFLKGCLRFRGQARAIDIGQLIHDQEWMIRNQGRFQTYMEVELGKLKKSLTAMTTMLVGKPRKTVSPNNAAAAAHDSENDGNGLSSPRITGKPATLLSSDDDATGASFEAGITNRVRLGS